MGETPISQQLGQSYKYYILCLPCVNKLEGDKTFRWAMFGPYGPEDADGVLVSIPYEESAIKEICQPYACDGCGIVLSIAPSSQWFIEKHRAERIGS